MAEIRVITNALTALSSDIADADSKLATVQQKILASRTDELAEAARVTGQGLTTLIAKQLEARDILQNHFLEGVSITMRAALEGKPVTVETPTSPPAEVPMIKSGTLTT